MFVVLFIAIQGRSIAESSCIVSISGCILAKPNYILTVSDFSTAEAIKIIAILSLIVIEGTFIIAIPDFKDRVNRFNI